MNNFENDAFDLYYQSRREREKRNLAISLIQKLIGLLCIGISTADAILLQDLTLGAIFVPFGVYLLFTREKVIH